jgi:hypothetical protein
MRDFRFTLRSSGYYAASSGNSGRFRTTDPETSVRNYHYALHINPE